jgi:hypothetical protein
MCPIGARSTAPRTLQRCFLMNCSLFMEMIGLDPGEAPETGWNQLSPIIPSLQKMSIVRRACSRCTPAEMRSHLAHAQGHATDALEVVLETIAIDKQERFVDYFWNSWVLAHLKLRACVASAQIDLRALCVADARVPRRGVP